MKDHPLHRYNDNAAEWQYKSTLGGRSFTPYHEQPTDVQAYYKAEVLKVRDGLTIGSFHMSGWLYWHLNYWKGLVDTPPMEGNMGRREMSYYKLRDNELYLDHLLQRAIGESKALLLLGTRRFAKTVFNASYLMWLSVGRGVRGTCLIHAGSSVDLSHTQDYIDVGFPALHEVFLVEGGTKKWTNNIKTFGADSVGNPLYTFIGINLEQGTTGKSQAGAGTTPIGLVYDEIGKFPFLQNYRAMKPALYGEHGIRTIPILVGTSGELASVLDAMRLFYNPAKENFLENGARYLERWFPTPSWDTKMNTACFMPGQMSTSNIEVPKIETTLGEHLGINDPTLDSIPIAVTNWKLATEMMQTHQAELKKGKEDAAASIFRLSYPMCHTHMFESSESNGFPTRAIHTRLAELNADPNSCRRIEFYRDTSDNSVKWKLSKKEETDTQTKGIMVDAPVLMYEDRVDTKHNYLYVAGLDHYKTDHARYSDSLGSLVIYKRPFNGEPGRIVATYTSRPDTPLTFNKMVHNVLEYYNAICLQEALDLSFQYYLQQAQIPEVTFLEPKAGITRHLNNKSQSVLGYGLHPTLVNNDFRLKQTYNYCNSVVEEQEDGEGQVLGVSLIPDKGLLKEMLRYSTTANVDRVVSFGLALTLSEFYTVRGRTPRKITPVPCTTNGKNYNRGHVAPRIRLI